MKLIHCGKGRKAGLHRVVQGHSDADEQGLQSCGFEEARGLVSNSQYAQWWQGSWRLTYPLSAATLAKHNA